MFLFGEEGVGFCMCVYVCMCVCVYVCVSGGMEGVAGIESILDWTSPRQEDVWLSGEGGIELTVLVAWAGG